MPRALNSRQLEAFRAVMISGSITRAGGLLSISQPAVTRLIKDLEGDLQIPLFLRQGPILIPTPEAREFYREVERHFIGTDHLRDVAMQLRSHGPARLRLSAFPAIANVVIPDAIAAFNAEDPSTRISIFTGASVDIIDHIPAGRADMTFLARPHNRTDMDYLPLPGGEVVCILPRSHPLAQAGLIRPADLHGQPFIALGQSSLMRMELDALLAAEGVQPDIRIDSLFSGTVVKYVNRGLGIAIIDPLVAAEIDPACAVVRRFAPAIPYQPSVVFAPNAAHVARMQRFFELAVQSYSAALGHVAALLRAA